MRRIVCALAVVLAGCMPTPLNVGYVAMNPSRRGGVDVQGQAGGGANLPSGPGGGAATTQIEPFVAPRVSLPIGAGLGGSGLGGHAPFRFGVRHRATRVFAYGAGIGPSMIFDRSSAVVSGVADLEVVLGVQKQRVGFSFGIRPALSFDADWVWVYVLGEPTLAIAIGPRTSLTLALPFGGWIDPIAPSGAAFMSGGIGAHRRF